MLHCLQVSTNFLSTRPVLQGLQDMVDVPLADEIVHGKHPQATTYLDQPALQQVSLHVGQLNDADLSCLAMHDGRACGVTRCWASQHRLIAVTRTTHAWLALHEGTVRTSYTWHRHVDTLHAGL